MAESVSANVEMLLRVVFLGGVVTELFITIPGAARPRQTKHELEDLIAVIDGRREIVADLAAASPDLRTYVADRN